MTFDNNNQFYFNKSEWKNYILRRFFTDSIKYIFFNFKWKSVHLRDAPLYKKNPKLDNKMIPETLKKKTKMNLFNKKNPLLKIYQTTVFTILKQ